MKNIFFPEEQTTDNDLYFLCYMVERIARRLHRRNKYVVNTIPAEEWRRFLCLANVLHCENPLKLEDEWIADFSLESGDFFITEVDPTLNVIIPTPTQMGKVYKRLIYDTIQPQEDEIDAFIRVYNNEICETIDNYNCSAFYEPSFVIAHAYKVGEFGYVNRDDFASLSNHPHPEYSIHT